MASEFPRQEQLPELMQLWKQVFGEYGGFWEQFVRSGGFSRQRCLCLLSDGHIAASLCWLDCSFRGRKLAYVYAVMTRPEYRGRGLCRTLLADTHRLLAGAGYAAAILVPEDDGLRRMYEKLGYETVTGVTEFSCGAGETAIPLRPVEPAEYGRLRRALLPENGIVQEGDSLSFLAEQTLLLAGPGVLLAAYREEEILHAMELLGPREAAPGIVKALGCREGRFRGPGRDEPFAMWFPLAEDAPQPGYFGLAFD